MEVRLRFFAGAREAMGRGEERRALAPGATVGSLEALLRGENARFAALPADMLVSVNLEYCTREHPLGDGDEVAFIPPVSGGAA